MSAECRPHAAGGIPLRGERDLWRPAGYDAGLPFTTDQDRQSLRAGTGRSGTLRRPNLGPSCTLLAYREAKL